MKRFLILFAAITSVFLLASCTKDGGAKEQKYSFKSDYVFVNNLEVIIFEYNSDGDIITNNNLGIVEKGKVYTFIADSSATKVKVYCECRGFLSSTTSNKWIAQVFMLSPGTTKEIDLTDVTIMEDKEP